MHREEKLNFLDISSMLIIFSGFCWGLLALLVKRNWIILTKFEARFLAASASRALPKVMANYLVADPHIVQIQMIQLLCRVNDVFDFRDRRIFLLKISLS